MPLTHDWPGFYKALRLKGPELLTGINEGLREYYQNSSGKH